MYIQRSYRPSAWLTCARNGAWPWPGLAYFSARPSLSCKPRLLKIESVCKICNVGVTKTNWFFVPPLTAAWRVRKRWRHHFVPFCWCAQTWRLQLNPKLSEIKGSFLGRMKLLKLFLILLLSQLSLCQDDSQLPKDAGTYYLSGLVRCWKGAVSNVR